MATEHVLEVPIRRHVIDSERPFASVLDGIFGGISRLAGRPALDTEVLTLLRQVTGAAAGT